jgi:hypothetical protein
MKKKKQLTENEIIKEFIGSLVNAIFKGKVKKAGSSAFYNDPRLRGALQTYIDDTEKFRKELKKMGLGSKEDLKKALASDPNVKNYRSF